MTLYDLMDPIYDPVFSQPRWYTADGRPMPWVGTIESGEPVDDTNDDAPSGTWEPIDLIGGEGGGE